VRTGVGVGEVLDQVGRLLIDIHECDADDAAQRPGLAHPDAARENLRLPALRAEGDEALASAPPGETCRDAGASGGEIDDASAAATEAGGGGPLEAAAVGGDRAGRVVGHDRLIGPRVGRLHGGEASGGFCAEAAGDRLIRIDLNGSGGTCPELAGREDAGMKWFRRWMGEAARADAGDRIRT